MSIRLTFENGTLDPTARAIFMAAAIPEVVLAGTLRVAFKPSTHNHECFTTTYSIRVADQAQQRIKSTQRLNRKQL